MTSVGLTAARVEWRLLTAGRAVAASVVFFVLASTYGALNGASWVRFQERTIAETRAEESGRIDSIATRLSVTDTADRRYLRATPALTAALGRAGGARYAVLDPAPLARLAVGQSDLLPYYSRISTQPREGQVVNDEIENPLNLLAGRFDLAFVVVFLYPLLILALSYNVVSAEREQGTLALMLAQPVDGRRIILAKIGVRGALVLAVTLGFAAIAAVATGVDVTAPGALPALALWAAVIASYGAFWFAAALAVNARARSSANNAVTLLGLWLAVVVIIPALVSATVAVVAPSPSRMTLITATRAAQDSAAAGNRTAMLAVFLEQHPGLNVGSADSTNSPAVAIAVQDRGERILKPAQEAFDLQLTKQQRMADALVFTSPALATVGALQDIAGTGMRRWRAYDAQVTEYHAAWRRYFYDRIFRAQVMTADDLRTTPAFTFREESTASLAAHVGVALAWVLIPTALLAAWGLRSLRRISLVAG